MRSRARSFRFVLALRFTLTMATAVAAVSVVSLLTLRAALDRELNGSILNVASIQAASLTDSPTGEMRFHEWQLTPEEARSLQDLIRYAQVWSADGYSLLRSQYMTVDLPTDEGALTSAAAGELVWHVTTYQGMPVRSLYYPLERLGQLHERHILQIAAPLVARNEMVLRVGLFLAGIAGLVVLGSFLGSWWLAGRAVRPVHEIIDQAEEIGGASMDRRIGAYADTTEYQRLVAVLNTMLDRIRGAFEAQRRFTADASHELRSPLTAMWGELELALRRARGPDEYRRVLASTLEEVQRLSSITEELLTLARSDAGALHPRAQRTDVASVVEQTVDRLGNRARDREIELAVAVDGGVEAWTDPSLLSRVVWNLMDNAVKFTPAGGRVTLRAELTQDHVVLRIEDTGPGLGAEPARVFEPFFRHDAARSHLSEASGTGLGLAIVAAILSAQSGTIEAENRPEGGARFTVTLPRHPSSGESPPRHEASTAT